jgi:hypothetical protein
MGDTHTEDDDNIAAEHWADDGGTSIPLTRKSHQRQDRWDAATSEHWQGYNPSSETQTRRDAEIAQETRTAGTSEK